MSSGRAVKYESDFQEYVKGSAPLKSTIITEQRSDVLYEVEKLLIFYLCKF
jgi:hypothetical protein